MANSTTVLLSIILVYWTVWTFMMVFARRSWIPVVPAWPVALFIVGIGLNVIRDWFGTIVVGAMHVVILFYLLPRTGQRN